jgi:hypothetical protein
MLKHIAIGSLGLALLCGTAAAASADTIKSPAPPDLRYGLPGAADGYSADGLFEGRSIYKMEDPSTFYDGSDEQGYPSGDPENPRTGG